MESSTQLVTDGQQPAHRRIFEELRRQILAGKFVPGSQLPGARELAASWQTSTFTIHTALQSLAREGWIERRASAGTYIANPGSRFLSAGIYHGGDIALDTNTSFARNLHFSLLNQLEQRGKKTQVFIDSRPEEKQDKILPDLAEALQQRRIQCVIAPSINKVDERYLARLPIPTSFLANSFSRNRVEFDQEGFFREGLRQLKEAGCRSVGFISVVSSGRDEKGALTGIFRLFQQAAKEMGVAVREDWICYPPKHDSNFELTGYREFKKFWGGGEKPDGLIVYPDSAARGVILAVLEAGVRIVTRKMRFVFHRNAQVHLLCPFPVIWAISDEGVVAREMIRLIEKQFAGEVTSPAVIPYVFRDGQGES